MQLSLLNLFINLEGKIAYIGIIISYSSNQISINGVLSTV